jgi:hypothetical protein
MRPLARHFIFERRGTGGQGVGIGHFENGGDAAENYRTGIRFPNLPMRRAGLAEMDLGVTPGKI